MKTEDIFDIDIEIGNFYKNKIMKYEPQESYFNYVKTFIKTSFKNVYHVLRSFFI